MPRFSYPYEDHCYATYLSESISRTPCKILPKIHPLEDTPDEEGIQTAPRRVASLNIPAVQLPSSPLPNRPYLLMSPPPTLQNPGGIQMSPCHATSLKISAAQPFSSPSPNRSPVIWQKERDAQMSPCRAGPLNSSAVPSLPPPSPTQTSIKSPLYAQNVVSIMVRKVSEKSIVKTIFLRPPSRKSSTEEAPSSPTKILPDSPSPPSSPHPSAPTSVVQEEIHDETADEEDLDAKIRRALFGDSAAALAKPSQEEEFPQPKEDNNPVLETEPFSGDKQDEDIEHSDDLDFDIDDIDIDFALLEPECLLTEFEEDYYRMRKREARARLRAKKREIKQMLIKENMREAAKEPNINSTTEEVVKSPDISLTNQVPPKKKKKKTKKKNSGSQDGDSKPFLTIITIKKGSPEKESKKPSPAQPESEASSSSTTPEAVSPHPVDAYNGWDSTSQSGQSPFGPSRADLAVKEESMEDPSSGSSPSQFSHSPDLQTPEINRPPLPGGLREDRKEDILKKARKSISHQSEICKKTTSNSSSQSKRGSSPKLTSSSKNPKKKKSLREMIKLKGINFLKDMKKT